METKNIDILDNYRRSQDAFDAVLSVVPTDLWSNASACKHWSLRDVAGHVTWSLEVLRHHLAGHDYITDAGPPGSTNPGALAGDDPLATWRAARSTTAHAIVEETLLEPAPAWFVDRRPQSTLADFVELSTLDTLVHAWDIGSAVGIDVRMEPDLAARSFSLARLIVIRSPTTFGPKLTPPPGADKQARLLSFLGRAI